MAFNTLRSRTGLCLRSLTLALCALLVALMLGRAVHEISHISESLSAHADTQHTPETPSPLHGKLCALCVALAHLGGGVPASLPLAIATPSYCLPTFAAPALACQTLTRAYESRAPPA